jgi:hypothetical protein
MYNILSQKILLVVFFFLTLVSIKNKSCFFIVSDSVYKAGNERKWKISMVIGVGKTWSLNIKFSRKSLNFPDQFWLATPIANPTPVE